jgi:hypothetical protein
VADFRAKAKLIAEYLDCVFVRRLVNNNLTQPRELGDELLLLVKKLRQRTVDEIQRLLGDELAELEDDFGGMTTFGLGPANRPQVRYLLARLTGYCEAFVTGRNRVGEYLDDARDYQIEHIWADKFTRYQAEVGNQQTFKSWRNRLGALLLLPRSDNASYRDDVYSKKLEYYQRQNILAASLHPRTYEKHPKFKQLRKTRDLEKYFRPFPNDFTKDSITSRQALCRRLCEIVWDPSALGFIVPAISPTRRVARRTRARYDVTVSQLLHLGLIQPNEKLTGRTKGQTYECWVEADGRIRVSSGEVFNAVSAAAMFVLERQSCNGWAFWNFTRGGKERPLMSIREDALKRGLLDSEDER